jgi:hypothetical protein
MPNGLQRGSKSAKLSASFAQDADNLRPRFGSACSPDRNRVVREGFGTFFDRYRPSTLNRIEEFDGIRSMLQIAWGAEVELLDRLAPAFSAPHIGIAPWCYLAVLRCTVFQTDLGLKVSGPASSFMHHTTPSSKSSSTPSQSIGARRVM